MKFKNREVTVIRPVGDDMVVVEDHQTGIRENARKDQIEGYTEEPGSKEVKQGLALNEGDKTTPKAEKEKNPRFMKAEEPTGPQTVKNEDAMKVKIVK